MSQERVLDIITHARNFYSQLSKYYDELSAVADRERVKILLDYLSECYTRKEQSLAEYEEIAPQGVIATWFKCGTDEVAAEFLGKSELTTDMDVDTVLREALRLDQCLSDLYQKVINRAETARIRDLFTSLLASNKKEMRKLARDCGHLQDW